MSGFGRSGSYGRSRDGEYGGGSTAMFVPAGDCGKIIGRGGSKIRELQDQTGCRITVSRDDEGNGTRRVDFSGADDAIDMAMECINQILEGGDDRGGRAQNYGRTYGGGGGGGGGGSSKDVIRVDSSFVGRIIGKGGSRIRELQDETGCRINPPTMGETYEPGSWNVEMEVNLFHAMRGHKPVGVNRHFHMIVIHEKLSSPTTRKLTAKDVWDHLSTMYDLQALNESEILPFPNKPVDFKLPREDFKLAEETDFPRMQNVGIASSGTEDSRAKPEGQAKGGKSSRSDGKATHLSKADIKGSLGDPKGTSSKGDSKSSTPDSKSSHISKADSKSGGSSSSGRSEGKAGGKGGHSSAAHASSSSTPDPSPKRTKRTRLNQSATNSPASDPTPAKRRR